MTENGPHLVCSRYPVWIPITVIFEVWYRYFVRVLSYGCRYGRNLGPPIRCTKQDSCSDSSRTVAPASFMILFATPIHVAMLMQTSTYLALSSGICVIEFVSD